ncbi:hypothetical protein PL9631_700020 [Planktothrix paucivesiculata PCC 9631]|uniref:Uncharacterized protein n=1 Tax=Planktothrix paucivesiculata PCC 9631 TaxID=671071 RepID=A0A7Z9C0S5_9CYAN|nr:hypothetical protein PL9631_700020 [Planktothrix paucivesiculata PCC 9631]
MGKSATTAFGLDYNLNPLTLIWCIPLFYVADSSFPAIT